ncbi:hypothetical protein F5Y09DRAFT_350645 [Xylaria sp. FL1042]|nr:hypothetical protein F5Y09DRAFT_350645 [Xylaria sp. FL1042]
MTPKQILTYDILLGTAPYLSARALLNLAATTRALNEALTTSAFQAALTVTEDCRYMKPVIYAIKNGDVSLLSRALHFLDNSHPLGWNWFKCYRNGVAKVLKLAATHSLESLQYLCEKYPLWPASPSLPASVIEHGFYTGRALHPAKVGFSDDVVDAANTGNRMLVNIAIGAKRFDCAAFLLKQYRPSLFPRGFELRDEALYFSSITNLKFLLDHGGTVGVDALHKAVRLGDSVEPAVWDLLVQKGVGVDSPRHGLEGSAVAPITTALCLACHSLQPANVETLLRLGAKPNGINDDPWIGSAPVWVGLLYGSPHPLLGLLFSARWNPWWDSRYKATGLEFIECFQSLIRHGAVVPLPGRDFLEILLVKIWGIVFWDLREIFERLPDCPDHPMDQDRGVRSVLRALSDADITPWDQVYQVVSETNPTWRGNEQTDGKARLIKSLTDYQDKYGDLPGPKEVVRRGGTVPDRYMSHILSTVPSTILQHQIYFLYNNSFMFTDSDSD